MEWFFRLCCEPRRLFKRYAVANPTYVVLFTWQLVKRWVLRGRYREDPLSEEVRALEALEGGKA